MKDKVDLLNGQRRRERVGLVDSALVTVVLALASMMALCHCGGAPFTALDSATLTDAALADASPAGDDAAVDSETSGDDAARGGGQDADAGGDADPPSKDADAQVDADAESPTLYTHHNGLGQTWQDTAPLGTYDLTEAMSACVAYTGDASKCASTFCDGTGAHNLVGVVGVQIAWAFASTGQGHVEYMVTGCPSTSDPSWE